MDISPPISIPLRETEPSEVPALVPKGPGVYVLRQAIDIAHLGWSPHLAARLSRLLSRSTGSNSTLGLRMREAGLVVDCWPTGSRLESSLLMYQLLRSRSPGDYRKRLRLNLPWFVTLTTRDAFPRLAVLNRIPHGEEPVFGPFKSRDGAQHYADDVLGCFGLRRCTDPLVPDPAHPGCIYGEIKQCLRPCQGAVSEANYGTEVKRVGSFLLTNGESSLRPLLKARDEAARALQFEEAANLHRLVGTFKQIGREREELVSDARALGGVALTKASKENAICLWPMTSGVWQGSHQISVGEDATPESIAREVKDCLSPSAGSCPETTGDVGEHLAILLRWYHSSWRDGHWYPLRSDKKLNVLRVGKAALLMLKK